MYFFMKAMYGHACFVFILFISFFVVSISSYYLSLSYMNIGHFKLGRHKKSGKISFRLRPVWPRKGGTGFGSLRSSHLGERELDHMKGRGLESSKRGYKSRARLLLGG